MLNKRLGGTLPLGGKSNDPHSSSRKRLGDVQTWHRPVPGPCRPCYVTSNSDSYVSPSQLSKRWLGRFAVWEPWVRRVYPRLPSLIRTRNDNESGTASSFPSSSLPSASPASPEPSSKPHWADSNPAHPSLCTPQRRPRIPSGSERVWFRQRRRARVLSAGG